MVSQLGQIFENKIKRILLQTFAMKRFVQILVIKLNSFISDKFKTFSNENKKVNLIQIPVLNCYNSFVSWHQGI